MDLVMMSLKFKSLIPHPSPGDNTGRSWHRDPGPRIARRRGRGWSWLVFLGFTSMQDANVGCHIFEFSKYTYVYIYILQRISESSITQICNNE